MTYYAIRFRSTDDLHRRGDILYGGDNALYIGQTPECQLRLAPHPDYADTCYAVIVRREQGNGWVLLRQEAEADIRVNGQPLAIGSSAEPRRHPATGPYHPAVLYGARPTTCHYLRFQQALLAATYHAERHRAGLAAIHRLAGTDPSRAPLRLPPRIAVYLLH